MKTDHLQYITLYITRQEADFYTHVVLGRFSQYDALQLQNDNYLLLMYYEIDLREQEQLHILFDYLTLYASSDRVRRFFGEFVSAGAQYVAQRYEKITLDGGLVTHWALHRDDVVMPLDDYEDQLLYDYLEFAYADFVHAVTRKLFNVGASLYGTCKYDAIVCCTRN